MRAQPPEPPHVMTDRGEKLTDKEVDPSDFENADGTAVAAPRPLPPFYIFVREFREDVIAKFGSAVDEDVLAELAVESWGRMTTDMRNIYVKKADQMKQAILTQA